ncbi:MAG: alpha-L-fucosidase [Bryobacteraceae bacterium]
MTIGRRAFMAAAALGTRLAARKIPSLAPYGALPSPRQLRHSKLETYTFLHFTVNTFTDKEWGYGDEDPAIFNPTAFDAGAIVEALDAAGMKGVILTCKHHDGFCLWPTRTTGHSVRNSPWRGGKGDVVKEISEAAKRRGLKFGVYLSPWDRNNAAYGSPRYIEIYRQQLRELLTGYGPVFEIWHDGANGGDGYYGGAREKRIIDKRTYYDWPGTWRIERELQPEAAIFSDVGPDLRWVGNEKGIAGETCWETYDPVGADGGPASPGNVRGKPAATGTRNGSHWMPAECDVSIRPGWFWHESENARVKTPAGLVDLYYESVGRGASLLLNVPPDRRGLLHENDVASLKGFGERVRATFGRNLAAGAKRTDKNIRGAAPEIVLDFHQPVEFNVVRIREDIRLGQRVGAFAVDVWTRGRWTELAQGTSIGACRLLRADAPIVTSRVRLRVTESPVPPVVSEFALFAEPPR